MPEYRHIFVNQSNFFQDINCLQNMFAPRLSVFLCFLLTFSICNWRWAQSSLHTVIITKPKGEDNLKIKGKPFFNLKAVQYNSKNSSQYYANTATPYFSEKYIHAFVETIKINSRIITKALFCAVKSYLHLLQLF